METEKNTQPSTETEKKSTTIRIELSDVVMKKINLIASLKDLQGKKADIASVIVGLAVNYYHKEVTVPELQNLTAKE